MSRSILNLLSNAAKWRQKLAGAMIATFLTGALGFQQTSHSLKVHAFKEAPEMSQDSQSRSSLAAAETRILWESRVAVVDRVDNKVF